MITNKTTQRIGHEPVHILLVGNNPIELSSMQAVVQKLPGKKVMTEIAFDLNSIWNRLMKFRPSLILIDDNIGAAQLGQTIQRLSADPKTKDVPIAVLKNSNYSSVVMNEVNDYVLKQNLKPETIYSILKHVMQFKQARTYLTRTYNKRKRQLLKLMR
ncbi:MAG: hypothetical protein MUE95_01045 [Cyclobacteriaceae bacterium]|jgi:CheY-like chemotaxis protein|nr:hypothetical protein [Cyclobacteriaceae bacterium]